MIRCKELQRQRVLGCGTNIVWRRSWTFPQGEMAAGLVPKAGQRAAPAPLSGAVGWSHSRVLIVVKTCEEFDLVKLGRILRRRRRVPVD